MANCIYIDCSLQIEYWEVSRFMLILSDVDIWFYGLYSADIQFREPMSIYYKLSNTNKSSLSFGYENDV